ncbi:MAG: molybdenum cofactor biosynthesis protein MoaAD [Gammaproteobacteria bacterium]|jgi:molybdenum cofactor guanylyltransferase|nr:molybdenum cofactor biosynthesis protein MoaAD [Gammaproteobacteria bacterium]
MSEPALCGLVLAGGRSSRMHRDKAALAYHGRSQLAATFELLESVVERCYVSVRADQTDEPLRKGFAQIVDVEGPGGPINGILAAQQHHPQAAWLVLACDLPFLDRASLVHLLAERDRSRVATTFRSSHDGLPEPLCAVYETTAAKALQRFVAGGGRCPRKFLLTHEVMLVEPLVPTALDNINSAQEYWQAMETLSPDTRNAPRTLTVQYFALLREQAGCSAETVRSTARTPAELYAELASRHPFSLSQDMLKVAINAEFGDWAQPLAEGDTVVFIPPVAGG